MLRTRVKSSLTKVYAPGRRCAVCEERRGLVRVVGLCRKCFRQSYSLTSYCRR